MAYEQTTSVNIPIAERIARGVGGAIQGAMQGADWAQRRKHTQEQMDALNQEMQARQQQMDQQKAQFKLQGLNSVGDMLFNAALSESPKDAINLMGDRLNTWGQALGQPMDLNEMGKKAESLKKVATNPLRTLNASMAALSNPAVEDSSAIQSYQQGKQALEQLKPYMSVDLSQAKANILDQAAQERFKAAQMRQLMGMRVQGQEAKAGNKAAEVFNKDVDAFSNYGPNKSLIENINKDKQITSLLTGVDPNNPDSVNNFAQELAKRLTVKASVGGAERITEQMLQRMNLNPALGNQMKALIAHKINNIALPADVTQLRKISNAIDSTNVDILKSAAKGFAQSRKGVDANELHSALKSRFGLSDESAGKQITKKLYSPSRNQTKLVYSDGSEEIVSGKQ